ncbi:MAG: ABC transporter ATP-binding protein [Candidatus Baldrarchaeia archaeon]
MNTVIEVSHVSKYYGEFPAVRDVSFKIPSKSCFGLLGPNGAGKTTTIKMILGLIKPNSGKIFVMGYPAGSLGAKKHIGYLPEKFTFNEKWAVLDMLTYVGILYGMSRKDAEERGLELLEWMGLSGWEYEKFGSLSAGMKQRVGITQALVTDPDILILDEPTTNLDVTGRVEILKKIRELVDRQGKTVLLSTHILAEVEKVADHVAIINRGVTIASGSLEELSKIKTIYHLEVNKPEILINELKNKNFIQELKVSGKTITIKTTDPEKFEKEALNIILKKNLRLSYFSHKGETLEELFTRLTVEEEK